MKKDYGKMTRKEILKIAKVYVIKGRHKMSKDKLIKAISKKKEPIKKMREFEASLKNEKLLKKYKENHIELLPKEPGTVYVHWEIEKQRKQPVLKLVNKKRSVLAIPVMSETGDGYMHTEEGESLKAVIGVQNGRSFKKIIESEEIIVPVSKPSRNKILKWVKIDLEKSKIKKVKRIVKETKALKEKKNKTENTAKTIKYIHIPKEK